MMLDPATEMPSWRILFLPRAIALFGLLLLVATWPLWQGNANFPAAPLFAWGLSIPPWVDHGAAYLLAAALAVLLVAPLITKWERAVCGLAVALWFLLFCLNQHRLQPWAYQFSLLTLLLATTSEKRTLDFARALAASIYIYSALGKFNEAFYAGMGATFVSEGLSWLHSEQWPDAARVAVVQGMPWGELAVGVGLAIATGVMWRGEETSMPRWAKVICVASVVGAYFMHLVLLLVLGPWGLGHHWGVLLWNLFFIAQAAILFHGTDATSKSQSRRPLSVPGAITSLMIIAALVMPATTRWGRWDHWLSWGLYSPGHGVVQVFVHPRATRSLPSHIRVHLAETSSQHYQRIDLSSWSLASTGAPIYPSDRFQAGVAVYVAELPSLRGWVTAGWLPPFQDQAATYEWFTSTRIHQLPRNFILNAMPRHFRSSSDPPTK